MDKDNKTGQQKDLNALLGLEKKPRSPKRIAAIVTACAVAAAGLGAGGYFAVASYFGAGDEAGSVTYRRYTVERGDVVVGQSESSSISLDRETVTFPVSATVEEVYVREGSSVRAGDPLVRMNVEDIETGLASYELQLDMVGLELEQAKLNQQSQLLAAQQQMESTQQSGELAAENAALTVTQLERAVTEAEENLVDKEQELEDWTACLDTLEEDLVTLEYYEDMAEEHQMDTEGNTWTSILSDFQEYYQETYGTIDSMDALEEEIALTEEELEEARLALEEAQLNLTTGRLNAEQQEESAQSNADIATSEYELTEVELEQAVEAAQETYDELEDQIEEVRSLLSDDGIVYADCNGLVASISVEEGDDVEVFIDEDTNLILSYATILTMTDISSVYVPITISEEDILNVSIGQEATVTMSAFPNQTFAAEVDTITVESARSGAATVSYTVNVRFAEENTLDMLEGMSAEVTLVQRAARDVLYVNAQAVTFSGGISTVLVEGADGQAEERVVETGFTDGMYVEIVSGLTEGETVLVESAVSAA